MLRETHYPAVIVQRMVCSVIDDRSYAGILYSRHPRLGTGVFLQYAKAVFGEDLMTGRLAPEERHFADARRGPPRLPGRLSFLGPAVASSRTSSAAPVMVEFTGGPRHLHDPPGERGRAVGVRDADGGDGHAPRRDGSGRPRPRADQALPRPADRIGRHRPGRRSRPSSPFGRGVAVLPRSAVTGRLVVLGARENRAAGRARRRRTSSWPRSDSRRRTPSTCRRCAGSAA